MFLQYKIDSRTLTVKTPDETNFFYGENICLSEINDITKNTEWYERGYVVRDFSHIIPFEDIKNSITESIKKIIELNYPNINLDNFLIENYHNFIKPNQHLFLDKLYKRLYPEDLGFKDEKILQFISSEIGTDLSYKDTSKNFEHWIIVRINMPASTGACGFNPAHKDIYEDYDERNHIPKMVNTWIPICGVNSITGLPIVPGSHLLKECDLLRTKSGSFIENQKYSVNCIKSWSGRNDMQTIAPNEGHLLIFSSHLIHGLGRNNNENITRVSLEFRLHEKTI